MVQKEQDLGFKLTITGIFKQQQQKKANKVSMHTVISTG